MMMVLIALLQSTQDADTGSRIRFVDHHGLEASLQSLILLEVLLILVQSGGTYAPQFTSGQCRLQYVGSIHGPFAFSCSHQCVNLIDEEDDASLALGHLVDHALESFLKFSLVLGSSHQCAHIQAIELLVAEVLGNISPQDSVCQTFHDGRLTCTGFAYEDGVVLGASGQNLQHAAYLIVTSDDRIQFACSGLVHQIACIFVQALISILAGLAGDLLSSAQFVDGLLQLLLCESHVLEHLASRALYIGNGHEQMFHGHILVTSLLCQVFGLLQHLRGLLTEVRLSSLHLGQATYLCVHGLLHGGGVESQLLEDESGDLFGSLQDTAEQVLRLNGLLSLSLCALDGFLHGLLSLDGVFVHVHVLSPFLF